MLSVPGMAHDRVRILHGVTPLGRVTVMHGPVYGPASQGGDGHHGGDDGEGRDDLPPHFISVRKFKLLIIIEHRWSWVWRMGSWSQNILLVRPMDPEKSHKIPVKDITRI